MLLRFAIMTSILCFGVLNLPADDRTDRGKLAGKWQPAAGEKTEYGTWTLEENNGSIRVTQESNGQKIAEYECSTAVRECDIKEGGHAAKLSMWFNGSKLVQMRTRGSEVVKRRFHITGDGDTLELEVIPVAPGGKPDLVHMSRLHAEADRKTQ
jgi:hypothetical protein